MSTSKGEAKVKVRLHPIFDGCLVVVERIEVTTERLVRALYNLGELDSRFVSVLREALSAFNGINKEKRAKTVQVFPDALLNLSGHESADPINTEIH